jgi:hypothetical protein
VHFSDARGSSSGDNNVLRIERLMTLNPVSSLLRRWHELRKRALLKVSLKYVTKPVLVYKKCTSKQGKPWRDRPAGKL